MKGNSNLNTSGIYWLYINPWVCSYRNQTRTTAYLLFNRKSNQEKKNISVRFGILLLTEMSVGEEGMMLVRNSAYIYTGVLKSISEVGAPTSCCNEIWACATRPLQGLVSPLGVWAGPMLWHTLKKSLICTSKGIWSTVSPTLSHWPIQTEIKKSRFSFW